MDAVDRQILAALQADGRLPNNALADAVGLSPSPCLRRVRRLEQEGIISGYRATLDRRALGLGLTVFVDLKVGEHAGANVDALRERIAAMEEVVAAHIVSGEADYRLEVVVADLEAYERLLLNELLDLPSVVDVRSTFAIRAVKAGGRLPLGPEPS